MRFLAGAAPIADWRKSLRFLNFKRYENQKIDEASRVADITMGDHLRRYGYTYKGFKSSELFVQEALKFTHLDWDDLEEPLQALVGRKASVAKSHT